MMNGIKVFAKLFSKSEENRIFVKAALRVFSRKIKLMKNGIKVFAKLFSKSEGHKNFIKLLYEYSRKMFKLIKPDLKVFAKLFSKSVRERKGNGQRDNRNPDKYGIYKA